MGGSATFSGTTYQARVIAFLYVQVLAQMPLGWFGGDDVPTAISAETGGPGDDVAIEFGGKVSAVEVQSKHGLIGGIALAHALERVISNLPADARLPIVLVLDRATSSRWIYTKLSRDLARLRTGRPDGLHSETKRLIGDLSETGVTDRIIELLHIVPIDVDNAFDAEAKQAFLLLQNSVLNDPDQATAAWSVLVADAHDTCSRRERRTRKDLVSLLSHAGIGTRHPAKDDVWHRRFDHIKQLLQQRLPEAALSQLSLVEKELGNSVMRDKVDARVYYRMYQLRAAALLQIGKGRDSLKLAQTALDYDSTGIEALVTASYASVVAGDLESAEVFANRAISSHPEDPQAWGSLAQSASARGDSLPKTPASIAESIHYRMVLVEIAVERGETERVLNLTSQIFESGNRSAGLLFQRANALVAEPNVSGMSDKERFAEAARLASDVIDAFDGGTQTLVTKSLLVRSWARRSLGQFELAEDDLRAAREADASDLDALSQESHVRAQAGDYEAARDLLRHPAVDGAPALIALRSSIAARMGDETGAKADALKALDTLAIADEPDEVRFITCDVALRLRDLALAHRILDDVSSRGKNDLRNRSLRSRLAFLEQDFESGEAGYRQAVHDFPSQRVALLCDLASNLLAAGFTDSSVATYGELSVSEIPPQALQNYAGALMATNDLPGVQRLIDTVATVGDLPAWALALSTDLAIRQDNTDKAVENLLALIGRRNVTPDAQIEVSRLLIEMGRTADAVTHIDALVQSTDLTAVQRMRTAQLLVAAGREQEGLSLGHESFRADPGDPRLHRAFILMTLTAKSHPPEASTVEVGTFVRLTKQDGTELEYIIVTDRVDPRRNELSLANAAAMGLIGKRVGEETVPLHPWQEKAVVREILPVLVHDAHEAAHHYAENFPSEPFLLRGFSIGEGKSPKEFAPIVSSLEARKQHVENVFDMYRVHAFPLGMFERLVGGSIFDAMEHIIRSDRNAGPLVVEWSDETNYRLSLSAASRSKAIVLTTSALKTAQDLGLLSQLAKRFQVIAPSSLRDEIRAYLTEAERMVREGHQTLSRGGDGLRFDSLPPGDLALAARLERASELMAFLIGSIELRPRPLQSIGANGSESESLRIVVGRSSYDAVVLAQTYNVPLYADDFGLRRLVPGGTAYSSFSSVALLGAMVDHKLISHADCDGHLVTLLVRRYAFIRPSSHLLQTAVRRAHELGEHGLEVVFATLGISDIEPAEAARIAIQVVRSQVTESVQLLAEYRIASLALSGMSRSWTPSLCVQLLLRVASSELLLLPQALGNVRRACDDFLTRMTDQLAIAPNG